MTKLFRKVAPKGSRKDSAKVEPRASVYDEVTATIIRQLEAGVAPWAKPWNKVGGGSVVMPANAVSAKRYSGINVLLLWGSMIERGYSSPLFLTFKQALDLGGSVRKGEKATSVVYADRFIPAGEKAKAEEENRDAKAVPFLKRFSVFNVEQCEGLPERLIVELPAPSLGDQWASGEALIKASGAQVRVGGNRAFYSPGHDFIQMPPLPAFPEPLDYYRTAAHELTHWTGHSSRLARNIQNSFGSKDYAREELVAEMGAAFTLASLGIEPALNHASYLASWIKVLQEDNRAIFKAASLATKAADFLLAKLAEMPEPDPDKLPLPVADPEPVAELPEPVEPVADPFGYYARKAARERIIRAAAPYRIDGQGLLIADFESLVARLASVSLAVDVEPSPNGTFPVYDPATGFLCGFVEPVTVDPDPDRLPLPVADPMPVSAPVEPVEPAPVAEPVASLPEPVAAPVEPVAGYYDGGRRVLRGGVPCKVYSRAASAELLAFRARVALVLAGELEWEPDPAFPGFTFEPATGDEAKLSPRKSVALAPKLGAAARSYYASGHRIVIGGVPCRIARKPASKNHATLIRQSNPFTPCPRGTLPMTGDEADKAWEERACKAA
jgi:antirestriction protein ArdC